MQILVADCVIDTDLRLVTRSGAPVTLSPKAYQLLSLLIEARPKPLSKQALHDALWPSTFVVEANLSNLVGEIRAALGDSARDQRIIRTLHGFGYAFAGEARVVDREAAAPAAPGYWLLREWEKFPLVEGENIIGRGEDAQVRLDAAGVSRRHARIVVDAGGATIEDLGSKNGTAVRGVRVTAARALADGDDIAVGSVRVLFRQVAPAVATTATVAPPAPTPASARPSDAT